MSSYRAQLQLYVAMLNRRSLRERAMILMTLVVVLVVVWNALLIEPSLVARKKTLGEIGRLKGEIALLSAEEMVSRQQASVDPDQESRQQIDQLKAAIAEFDRKLEEHLVDLLSPEEMSILLQKILKQQKGLRLITMENLPAEPLFAQKEGEKSQIGLYRHALRMELEGRYLNLLAYLEILEKLPHKVFWDILTVDTKEFPLTRIRLQIHTLSLKEDWIGG